MKILVSNNHLSEFGGSETFTYAIASVLKRLGHEVDLYIYSKIHNPIFLNALQNQNINVYQTTPPKQDYYMILANHTSTIEELLKYYDKKIIIQTCHGIVPTLERPHHKLDHFVSVSNEIYHHLQRFNIKSIVIPNGIDCERFKSISDINDKPKIVLSLVQDSGALNNIKTVCKELNIDVIYFSKFSNKKTFDVEKEINKADIVISVGRGVFEALSCGRNVISYDSRNYYTRQGMGHGLLSSVQKIEEALIDNFTGRNNRKFISKEQLKQEILKYDKNFGKIGQTFIKENFDMEYSIQKYFQILNP